MRNFKLVRHLRRLAIRGCTMSSTSSVVWPEHNEHLSNSARALKKSPYIYHVDFIFFAIFGGERAGFCCPIKSCRTPHRIVKVDAPQSIQAHRRGAPANRPPLSGDFSLCRLARRRAVSEFESSSMITWCLPRGSCTYIRERGHSPWRGLASGAPRRVSSSAISLFYRDVILHESRRHEGGGAQNGRPQGGPCFRD